jgi:hypothetical protein
MFNLAAISVFSKIQRQIWTFTKFSNILDFVYWRDNPSNKTPAIEIPDYHSTLMCVEISLNFAFLPDHSSGSQILCTLGLFFVSNFASKSNFPLNNYLLTNNPTVNLKINSSDKYFKLRRGCIKIGMQRPGKFKHTNYLANLTLRSKETLLRYHGDWWTNYTQNHSYLFV